MIKYIAIMLLVVLLVSCNSTTPEIIEKETTPISHTSLLLLEKETGLDLVSDNMRNVFGGLND